MAHHTIIKIIITALLGLSMIATADDGSSNTFFPKNYVQDNSINEHSDNDVHEQPTQQSTPTSPPSSADSFKEVGTDPSQSNTIASPAPTVDLRDGIKTDSISLIVDATDYDELKKYMRMGDEFSLEHKIPFKTIYSVGLKFMPPEQFKMDYYGLIMAAAAQGVTYQSEDTVPAKYPVKQSPTWIVNTVKGEVILEGVTDLNSMFNSENLFLGPQM
jgi:hypothetical protein